MHNIFIKKLKKAFEFFAKQKASLSEEAEQLFDIESLLPYQTILDHIISYTEQSAKDDFNNNQISILELLKLPETPNDKILHLHTAKYGSPIELIFGENLVQGKIIWIHEVQIELKQNLYTEKLEKEYYLSFAMAICEGEILELQNIFLQDRTILNQSQYIIRIYRGTKTQMPDPLIKSIEHTTPAFRDLAYVVFENFPISKFNNKIPNLYFNIVRNPNISFNNGIIENSESSVANIIKEISLRAKINLQNIKTTDLELLSFAIFNKNISCWNALNILKITYKFEITLSEMQIHFVNPEFYSNEQNFFSIENFIQTSYNSFLTINAINFHHNFSAVNLFFMDDSLRPSHVYHQNEDSKQSSILNIRLPLILDQLEAIEITKNILQEFSKEKKLISFILTTKYFHQILPSKIIYINYQQTKFYIKIISLNLKFSKIYAIGMILAKIS